MIVEDLLSYVRTIHHDHEARAKTARSNGHGQAGEPGAHLPREAGGETAARTSAAA